MARLVLPSTSKGHGWRRDTPDHRDRPLRARLGDPITLPNVVELDPTVLSRVSIRDQGDLGSCTGHGIRGCLVYHMMKRTDLVDTDLSPLFAYYRGRVAEASVNEDSGCEIRDVVKMAAQDGVALESAWPYRIERFKRNPTATAYKSAQVHQVKVGYYRCGGEAQRPEDVLNDVLRAINAQLPVTGGFACFSNLDRGPRPGVIPLPGPRDRLEGGHAVWFVRADQRERLLKFQNSWSAQWGDRGFGYLPFDYILKRLADDFWCIDHE